VLSVDRVDYTKGILERLECINEFFNVYPSWRGEITFVQLCQRSRPGLNAFDAYWNECLAKTGEINSRWGEESWKPILWVPESVSQAVLSGLYQKAAALLVTPLRDGLNLTAKEFVACSNNSSGPLLLSKNAGVWQEFGEYALPLTPSQPVEMASSIARALSSDRDEHKDRLRHMRESLEENTLSVWWQKFGGKMMMPSAEHPAVIPACLPAKRRLLSGRFSAVGL
jgi:trehalose 6-phosphate synthase